MRQDYGWFLGAIGQKLVICMQPPNPATTQLKKLSRETGRLLLNGATLAIDSINTKVSETGGLSPSINTVVYGKNEVYTASSNTLPHTKDDYAFKTNHEQIVAVILFYKLRPQLQLQWPRS